MNFDAWFFSAKLAWGNLLIRWLSIVTIFLVVAMSGFYVWQIFPSVKGRGYFIMHYNLYLGIDDVRNWPWVFVLPIAWLIITLIDLAFAYGVYRLDVHFAVSLALLAFSWSIPWSGALFYLTFMNA